MIAARRRRHRYVAVLVTVFALPLAASQQSPPPRQAPGTIRTSITMVPLDVRVVDQRGRPVTELTQADFAITENEIEQKIAHFSTQGLVPVPDMSGEPLSLRRADAEVKPRTRRVFLLMLGRGRMTGPSKEIDAIHEFLRDKLLPQDLVAFTAYNRATDFTTAHADVAAVVARYKERHTRIEALLAQYFSGLRAVYGSRTIPSSIQSEIDAVFEGDKLRARQVTPGQIADEGRIKADVRQTADELVRAELLRARPPESPGLPDPAAEATADMLDLSFDEYIERQAEQLQDLGNLYAGIEYLRRLEGEKHVAFVTPRGLLLPRAENDRSLAAIAADARVAIDIIFTGGVVGAPPPRFSINPGGGLRINMPPVPSASAVFGQTFNVQSLRRIAELTGGQLSAFRSGREAFNRIDDATRFQYLLAYYPSNANWNGAFRNIRVKVNRPGVTVHYRRGYFASPQLVPVDRREFLTFTRLAAAGRYTGELTDIGVSIERPAVTMESGVGVLDVQGRIRASRVKFEQSNGSYAGSLDIGIYAGDDKQRVIGETLKRVELKLTPEQHAALLRDGAPFNARIRIDGVPRFVKVVVYDYGSDLLGTAIARMPER